MDDQPKTFIDRNFFNERKAKIRCQKRRAKPGSPEYVLENISSPQHQQLMAKSFIPGLNSHFGSSPLLPEEPENHPNKPQFILPEKYFFSNNFSDKNHEQMKKHDKMPLIINGETILLGDAIQKILFDHPTVSYFNFREDPIPEKEEAISFICPFSFVPITCPGKSVHCKHRQCFDLKEFISMQSSEEWKCPICGIPITFDDLQFDPFFFRPPRKREETFDRFSYDSSFL